MEIDGRDGMLGFCYRRRVDRGALLLVGCCLACDGQLKLDDLQGCR